MSVLKRNNVVIRGNGSSSMLFAHGFGCDQNMWRFVAPAFEDTYQTILFDQVGAGNSDLAAYSKEKYSSLDGYANDIVEIGQALKLNDAVFVGHSVSAMMGILAAIKAPQLFNALVLVCPSPYYINDGDYTGGFTRSQIDELLEALDSNHLGWSMAMAPVIMGELNSSELKEELANSFCRTNPDIAKQFARTTFLSDSRSDLQKTAVRTLVLQCTDDAIAPQPVGDYVHKHMRNSELVLLEATGHCPNLSAPKETIEAIKNFLVNESVA